MITCDYLRTDWFIPGTQTRIDAMMFEEHEQPPACILADFPDQAGEITMEWRKRRKMCIQRATHLVNMVAMVGVSAMLGGLLDSN